MRRLRNDGQREHIPLIQNSKSSICRALELPPNRENQTNVAIWLDCLKRCKAIEDMPASRGCFQLFLIPGKILL